MPVFGSSDALIRRRRRQRGLAVAAALALPAILAFLFEATHDPAYQFVAAMIACFEAVGFLLLPAIAPQGILTGERRGELRVDRTGVWFRKKLALPRDQIESVWVEAREEGGRFVHLAARKARDDLAILVEDEKHVSTLLEALDLRHDRHAAGFVVESAALRTVVGQRLTRALVLLGGALLGGAVVYHAYRYALVGFALVPVLALYSMTLRRMRLTSRLVAGADGIVVRAGGVLRQIPFAGVRTVTRSKAEAVVELDTREALTLRFVGEGAEAKCNAFVSRVKKSVACVDRKPDPFAALLLPAASGGRGVQEWLAELRRITGGGAGYRQGAVPDEELWRLVENPGADAGARAGALAALRPRLDEIGRVRIGELAGGTAHRDLRAALEAAAAGETDEAILEAYVREGGEAKPRA